MFYIMTTISEHPALNQMPGTDVLRTLMGFGSIIIGIFSVILIFYTNNFLMRRRKKELGLYNILGMEKSHIAKIMFHETLFVSIVSLLAGILSGILFSRLIMLLLIKVIRFQVAFTPYVSKMSIVSSIILFGIIFLLCLLTNLAKIKLANPIELLRGSNVGEKEPKTKWLLAILGFGCIGAGYYIAISTESPLDALLLFFLAVLLVIIGTYCLFTAGSILILKLLRKNRKFYYQTRHFTAISGMLYRMKQNAVGLANICILCTMVLVMVSGTVSLYLGMEDALDQRYPNDIMIRSSYDSMDELELDTILTSIQEAIKEGNAPIDKIESYHSLTYTATVENDKVVIKTSDFMNTSGIHDMVFVPLEDYNRISNQSISLQEGEVLAYHTDETLFGMSRAEVKRSIRSQVLMVFFIPLVMAAIHVLAAFPMITKLLSVLYLTNVSLFAICTVGTILIFAVIYAAVYIVTERTYYKIVGEER